MLIVMKPNAAAPEIEAVVNVIQKIGLRPHPMPGATRTAIGITGNQGPIDGRRFENLPGVAEVIRVTKPYKLITLDLRPDKTVVRVGDATIGGGELAIIAGPCAIESREQAFTIAKTVQQSGARFFRGCVWKPRTSPYTFQGLGDKGWEIMAAVREEFDLKVVTEAVEESHVDLIEKHGDVIQIGARNMQNFSLLKRAVRRISHLPVIVDPSHGTGTAYMVTPLARAGVATGADGLMIEVHNQPELSLSDSAQALTPSQYLQLVAEVRAIHQLTASEKKNT